MLIRNPKMFNLGALFAVTFFGVLFMIFSPVFSGKNGLEFADESFNKLAKGSSYFIPKVSKSVEKFAGKTMAAGIGLETSEDAVNTEKILKLAGAKVTRNDVVLMVEGDFTAILGSALKDADAMFNNNGKAVSDRYGMDEKKALKYWWTALAKIEKQLKKDKNIEMAKMISDVNKKGIEPGYNFYQIDANKVIDHAGMMSGLLIFYVFYTMWWGYAIFYLFDGIGLTMKKAKVKKEA
ncbi:MAG: hypothetical protein A2010_15275 [Nitrospirae bacterium GWD2_57_9]|nr:MAG: hypothetical protein A2010_15275 [Nitrospirae bacterium GWD2_57_9]